MSRNYSEVTQAIVLAAGLGTRLRPLTERIPKPLLPVGGVPLLLFNLVLLKAAGIRDITINLHHLPEKIRRFLRNSPVSGIELQYSLEPRILGTAGGIAQALRRMKNQSTLVINGDILMDLDLGKFFQAHQGSKSLATLACVPKNFAKVESFVESDKKGRIYRIAGGPPLQKRPPPLRKSIFAGVHLLEPVLFKNYPAKTFGCVIRQIYQPALAQGKRLQAYFHAGSWWDLGSLAELRKVDRMLWQRKAPKRILDLYSTTLKLAPSSR